MIGYFDDKGNPKVILKIKGTQKEKTISALFDTGHSGTLSLPFLYLIEIGAELKGVSSVRYADGRVGAEYLFSVSVELNGIKKEIKAALIPNPKIEEAIAGIQLFDPFVVILNFKNKKFILKTDEELRKLLNHKEIPPKTD